MTQNQRIVATALLVGMGATHGISELLEGAADHFQEVYGEYPPDAGLPDEALQGYMEEFNRSSDFAHEPDVVY